MELCFGTVQLGIDYGVAGVGKPREDAALGILGSAWARGIHCFDTSESYGTAESLIGKFVGNNKLSYQSKEGISDIKIITKCKDPVLAVDSFHNHLDTMGVSVVMGVLMHVPNHLYQKEQVLSLNKIKEKGFTNNIGVSVYEPEDALFAAKCSWIDFIQVPYNVFDQRLDKNNFFRIASQNNKKIFARSSLLQGLLTMNEETVFKKMPFAFELCEKFGKLVNGYGLQKLEAALMFIKANKSIDYLVFGVDAEDQLINFIDTFNLNDTNDELLKIFRKEFNSVDDRIISPTRWNI